MMPLTFAFDIYIRPGGIPKTFYVIITGGMKPVSAYYSVGAPKVQRFVGLKRFDIFRKFEGRWVAFYFK